MESHAICFSASMLNSLYRIARSMIALASPNRELTKLTLCLVEQKPRGRHAEGIICIKRWKRTLVKLRGVLARERATNHRGDGHV